MEDELRRTPEIDRRTFPVAGAIPSPPNPVELSGGQFHLRAMTICMQPTHTDRDTQVEIMGA